MGAIELSDRIFGHWLSDPKHKPILLIDQAEVLAQHWLI